MKEKFSKLLPDYARLPLLLVVVWNQSVYYGARLLTMNRYHYNIELDIDRAIPFLPWTVSIYFLCYLFWAANYIICARQDKETAYRFMCADCLAKGICFVCFLLLPTTNIRPIVEGNTIWDELMRFLYASDSADNLFPSIHCLVSWFCYIGIRGKQNIPLWYRGFSFAAAIAVFFSTLATRQHVMVDVIGGVILAEVCYWITGHTGITKAYTRLMDKLRRANRKI